MRAGSSGAEPATVAVARTTRKRRGDPAEAAPHSEAVPADMVRGGAGVCRPIHCSIHLHVHVTFRAVLQASSPCAQAVKRTRSALGALAAVQQENAQAVAETPALATAKARGVPFTPAVPATAMRVPVLGETFYSQKGTLCTLCSVIMRRWIEQHGPATYLT